MNLQRLFLLSAVALSGTAFAADNAVMIHAPADGAVLKSMEKVVVDYEVTRGPGGDHIHLYVDDKERAVLRQPKASYTLDPLDTGEHTICIKMVNKAHTPINVEQCIKVRVP